MRITFFPGSVVGYVDYSEALFTRGLADGLAGGGNDVRVVEERQNANLTRTLRAAGAEPSRHFHQHFSHLHYHTFEPRSGAPLLEWLIRELSLIDVAVVVDGAGIELCRWIANISDGRLIRAYLTFNPAHLTDERANELELERFDLVLAPSRPAATLPWSEIRPALAGQDDIDSIRSSIPDALLDQLVSPRDAATAFEQIVNVLKS